jgi:hypothetical protein
MRRRKVKKKLLTVFLPGKYLMKLRSDFMDKNFYRDNLAGFAGSGEKQEADQRLVEQKNKDQTSPEIRFDFDR